MFFLLLTILLLVMAEVEEVQDAVAVMLAVVLGLLSFLLEVVWHWLLLPWVYHMVVVEGVGHGVFCQGLVLHYYLLDCSIEL